MKMLLGFLIALNASTSRCARSSRHRTVGLYTIAVVVGFPVSAPAAFAQQVTLTSLFSFSGYDGANPYGALIHGVDGSLYGTTVSGGDRSIYGTIFQITSSGSLTTLHSFNGIDGANPYSSLIQADDGSFYGTTINGGTTVNCSNSGCGTVFKLSSTDVLTTLYSFSGGADGAQPYGGLIQAKDGNLYGTTSGGGTVGGGTIFKITPDGALTTLYSFDGSYGGIRPFDGLIQAKDGNFYGVAYGGGAKNCGTVFRITPAGTFTALYSFSGFVDGANPYGGLIQGSDGNFYGTTTNGGNSNSGTIYKITPAGVLTSLYSFKNADDGLDPQAALVQARDGHLYGTTVYGGSSGYGTVFQISPEGIFTTLYSFNPYDGGIAPIGALIQDSDGYLYGTTSVGGNGGGIVFKLTVPPSAPTSLAVKFKVARTAMLTWSGVPGATSYNVYEGTAPGAESPTPIKTGVTGTTVTVTGLTKGVTYYFTVAAVNLQGVSQASNEVSVVVK